MAHDTFGRPGTGPDPTFRLIVESALDYAIFAMDLRRRVTIWNRGAERLLGYTDGEMVGLSADIVFTLDDRAALQPEQEADTALREGRAENERWHLRKDGSRFWGSGLMMPLRGDDGEVRGLVKIMRDRTEIRQIQHERTDLLQALEEANRALTLANQTKDELLGLVSHELRTPLTTIVGTADVLLRQRQVLDEETQEQALRDILAGGQRLQNLIENMLVLGQLEAGENIEQEPILLQRLVPAIVGDGTRGYAEREFVLDVPGDLPPVMGQATYVQQVIQNFLTNAGKYSEPPAPIEVRVTHEGADGVAVRVLDRGPGVLPEEVSQLFDPFFRARTSRGKASGAGLGLAVARRMVEAQGGRIWASNREGGGLEVGFTLPLDGAGEE